MNISCSCLAQMPHFSYQIASSSRVFWLSLQWWTDVVKRSIRRLTSHVAGFSIAPTKFAFFEDLNPFRWTVHTEVRSEYIVLRYVNSKIGLVENYRVNRCYEAIRKNLQLVDSFRAVIFINQLGAVPKASGTKQAAFADAWWCCIPVLLGCCNKTSGILVK